MKISKKVTKLEAGIAGLMLVALLGIIAIKVDPAKTLADASDTQRRSHIVALSDAITQYQADNGEWPSGIDADSTTNQVLGISGTGCHLSCGAVEQSNEACLDITGLLVTEYLDRIPADPESGSFKNTDYYVNITESGKLMVGACDPTNISAINVLR